MSKSLVVFDAPLAFNVDLLQSSFVCSKYSPWSHLQEVVSKSAPPMELQVQQVGPMIPIFPSDQNQQRKGKKEDVTEPGSY